MNPINFGNGVSLFHWTETSPWSRKSLESEENIKQKATNYLC